MADQHETTDPDGAGLISLRHGRPSYVGERAPTVTIYSAEGVVIGSVSEWGEAATFTRDDRGQWRRGTST